MIEWIALEVRSILFASEVSSFFQVDLEALHRLKVVMQVYFGLYLAHILFEPVDPA